MIGSLQVCDQLRTCLRPDSVMEFVLYGPFSHLGTSAELSVRHIGTVKTRHTASTSTYSLTFCVRFLMPERHQRKPAVQATAVMLRTTPFDGQSPASQPRLHFPYTTPDFENAPVTRQSAASSARRPRPAGRSHYVVISRGWTQACN